VAVSVGVTEGELLALRPDFRRGGIMTDSRLAVETDVLPDHGLCRDQTEEVVSLHEPSAMGVEA
jgi:hypothetical protein